MNRLSACLAILWLAAFWPMACLLAHSSSCAPTGAMPPHVATAAACAGGTGVLEAARQSPQRIAFASAARFGLAR